MRGNTINFDNGADIYLKDEGLLGGIFFNSEAAQVKAVENGIENQYSDFDDVYRYDMERVLAKKVVESFESGYGFKVEKEY